MASSHLTVTVRYQETDAMARVYHGNYFTWLDMARTEFLRERGVSYRDMETEGFFFVVAEATCNYKTAARFDDTLEITTTLAEFGKVSVVFTYEIRNKSTGQLITTARTKLGVVDKSGKIIKIPPHVLTAIA